MPSLLWLCSPVRPAKRVATLPAYSTKRGSSGMPCLNRLSSDTFQTSSPWMGPLYLSIISSPSSYRQCSVLRKYQYPQEITRRVELTFEWAQHIRNLTESKVVLTSALRGALFDKINDWWSASMKSIHNLYDNIPLWISLTLNLIVLSLSVVKHQFKYFCQCTVGSWCLLIFHRKNCLFQLFHSEKWNIFGGGP